MPAAAGDEQDLALADGDVARLPILNHLENHVSAQLVEEFLVRVVMVVGARVRPADHLDDQVLGLAKDDLVADRRLEQMGVLVDPALEVEGGEGHVSF